MNRKDGSTRFAILGILSLQSMSGYEIKQAYEQGVANFWSISYGQIYPLLRELLQSHLIEKTGETGARDNQRYGITKAGRLELEKWLEREPREAPSRNEMLLKMFFAAPDDLVCIERHLAKFLSETTEQLRTYDETREWLRREHGQHSSYELWDITLDYGYAWATARKQWAESTLRKLKSKTKRGKK